MEINVRYKSIYVFPSNGLYAFSPFIPSFMSFAHSRLSPLCQCLAFACILLLHGRTSFITNQSSSMKHHYSHHHHHHYHPSFRLPRPSMYMNSNALVCLLISFSILCCTTFMDERVRCIAQKRYTTLCERVLR
jgi:hypothetical protein